ncbi:RNA polymerase sigma factor SigJ [Amycolatopsis acidiphila]|uniref:Sigma-70 family RNA polymerase sigma factor n=1 Tax=Amycolatopsis acidiphila TaxID=715473 RepID=A0A558ACR0_9PSEU|nr:RNA polymerase sigma factor SigJ [Amycolatopsis acidiphila]TVT22060.1 sigma-70 family RNA polymerase sigma factor [Amycolatopsis acidiphila]UIJ63619.1 RNA polymerase sigma factor SigJ [Amycolatopsis acidiphila]GHG67881.1 DNA-directed RNA polymerase sigma-70 factor [Amycolatopsis acidiphila]
MTGRLTEDVSVDEREFERHRPHLRAVAYRMLGSLGDAEDVVQEAWFRLERTGAGEIENLAGWLTTVVARLCLDLLRSRTARREDSLGVHLPDPVISHGDGLGPEDEALLADSVGLALLVVLETLAPAERLALVLHDSFGVPFDEIASILGRTPTATRQLASRARRRIRDTAPTPDADPARQREVVEAFRAAARAGDFNALVAVLDPDVALRVDLGTTTEVLRGAAKVAGQALSFARLSVFSRPVLVNGAPGLLTAPAGKPVSVMSFTVVGGRIVEIDILADPDRLASLREFSEGSSADTARP